MTKKIYSHVAVIIPDVQHGFVSGRSTNTNLLENTQFLHENLNKCDAVDVVYFHFSKAFDHVNHRILAAKLAGISMPITLFKVVMAFITYRSYTLKVDGQAHSNSFITHSGVPQSLHCGPILYILMTRDVTTCIHNTGVFILIYADDTKMYRVINCIEDMRDLQSVIDKLDSWSQENELLLNSSKTFHVSFSHKRAVTQRTYYYLRNDRIQSTETVRDLGILFDTKLIFKPHVEQLVARANVIAAIGFRFSMDLHSPRLMNKIINTYITPIIEYDLESK